MNTEKIEKLKKGLNNAHISEAIKTKIKEQIAKLESEDLSPSNISVKDAEVVVIEEEKPKEPETKSRKPKSKNTLKLNTVFNIGDLVYDKTNARYGIVLNNYGDNINGDSDEIRLDSDGNQSIYKYDNEYNRIGYNLVPYNSAEAVKPLNLSKLKSSAKSLIESAEENLKNKPKDIHYKENVEYYKKAYSRLLNGEFDDKEPSPKEPKRTVLVIAKEIRKEGESWNSARERASKLINKSKDKAEVKAKKELEKLDKFIKTRKELDGISGKNLMRDAKRNAKQLGKRTVTHEGVTSNQYGTFKNKLGSTYYENRDGHGDRLSNSHRKGQPFLEKGGKLSEDKLDKEAIQYITGKKVTHHHREANNIAYKVEGYDNWRTIPIEELNEVIKNHEKSLTIFAPEKDKTYKDGGSVNYNYERGKNYPVKTISVEDGERLSISDFPNFSKTGSISGMKKQYYGKDALLVRCGNYIYNVTSNPEIYFNESYENGGDFMNNVYKEGGEIDNKHTYMMLGRLQMDCDYYLGHGNRSERHLWAGNVDEQIEEMKRLWNSLPKNGKPEWLSMEDILDYEKKMKSQSNEDDEYENGGDFMNNVYEDGGSLKEGDYVVVYKSRGSNRTKVFTDFEKAKKYAITKEDSSINQIQNERMFKLVSFRNGVSQSSIYENGGDFMNNVYEDGGMVNEEKRFEVDFYKKKSDYEPHSEKIYKSIKLIDLVDKITEKIKSSDDYEYAEFYHKNNGTEVYLGKIYKDNSYVFVQGNGYIAYIENFEKSKPVVNKDGVKVQSAYIPKNMKSEGEWMAHNLSSNLSRAYEDGGDLNVDEIQIEVYKGFHGLKAESYIDNVNGLDWHIVTMKRHSGQLVTTAQSGKSLKKDGEVELFTFEYKSPNITLISTKPSRVTAKTIEAQHKEGLAVFKEKMANKDFENGGDVNSIIGKKFAVTDKYELKIINVLAIKEISEDNVKVRFGYNNSSNESEQSFTKEEIINLLNKGDMFHKNERWQSLENFDKERKIKKENGGDFMNNVYEDGGSVKRTINLVPLELVPLSTQLSQFTGDALASGVYVNENGKDYSTAPDAIIVHKESGQKFRLPAKIYDRVDGYKLVINKSGKEFVIVDYSTNLLVAEIKDGKLDFSNKDESISIDRTKVISEFEKGHIPNEKNADDEYKKIEQELLVNYSLYEDAEDDKEKAKEINDYIHYLEGITHRLERKYESGGTIEGKTSIGKTSSGKDVYDGVSEYSKIYKDFNSKDHLDASNLYMSTDLSDLPMSERDEYSAGHFRKTDEYKNDLLQRKANRIKGMFLISEDKFGINSYRILETDVISEDNVRVKYDNGSDGSLVIDRSFSVSEILDLLAKKKIQKDGVNWQEYDSFMKSAKKTLKKDLGGTFIIDGLPNPDLNGDTGMDYTGLVGETSAMSAGEIFADGGDVTNKRTRRTKDQISKDNHNEEIDAYKWYVIDVKNKKALSGWEFKEDAKDDLSDYDGDKNFKVVAKSMLKTLDIPNPNEEWKYEKGGDVNKPTEEEKKALEWYNSLSMNEQKLLSKKYLDTYSYSLIHDYGLSKHVSSNKYRQLRLELWNKATPEEKKGVVKGIEVKNVKKPTKNNERMQKATAYAKANWRKSEGQTWREAMKEGFEKTK